MATKAETNAVYAAGLIQGITRLARKSSPRVVAPAPTS